MIQIDDSSGRTPSLEFELALKGKLRKVTLPDGRPRLRFSSPSDVIVIAHPRRKFELRDFSILGVQF